MKFIYNSLFHSVHCSSMFRSVKILSVHPRPLRNSDCSFRRRSSTAWVMRCIMTLQKILLGTDKRVIPRQLLQSLRDPFFGILIITLLWYLDHHTSLVSWLSHSNVSSSPRLDIPKGSPPFPIDQQMVNLISIPAIRGTPCDFMDLSVWKKGAPYHQIISCAKLNKPFSFSLMMPLPCLPITLSLPELSAPTLAFRSHMMMIVQLI